MNITPIQWMLIVIAALGAISGGSAQMTDLFGAVISKDIASAASFLSSIISAILMPLTGQSAQIKAVAAMPGVEKVEVNAKANPTLATLAIDPHVDKIAPIPAALIEVTKTAQGI